MTRHRTSVSRRALLAAAASLGATVFVASADAADVTVAAGATSSGQKVIGGTDTVTVGAGGTLTSSSSPTLYQNGSAATGVTIDNSGTIQSTGTGSRAIRFNTGTAMTFTLDNRAGAVVRSQGDAININPAVTSGTILVENAGTIESTGVDGNNGQAIDFAALAAGTASVTIDNYATGLVQTADADAIRPGNNATVNNWGTISASNYGTNSGSDGIDFQTSRAGTVHNYAGGVISGGRHGINIGYDGTPSHTTYSLTVINDAGGQIIGRNGSGFGSDVSGSVTNYGLISGRSDSIPGVTAGDGDGVDIDYAATIQNYGTIEGIGAKGTDSTGNANLSEGLSIGGGSVENHAGATISGYGRGITVTGNDRSVGVTDKAYFAVDITNAGTIQGLGLAEGGGGGAAIRLYSDQNDTITNSGTISGAGSEAAIWVIGTGTTTITNSGTITATGTGDAILLGSGDDRLAIRSGSVITGAVDGGAGTDAIDLSGTGTAAAPDVFAGAVNFESLAVTTGVWRLAGSTQGYANGISIASGATLDAAGTIASAVTVASGATLAGTGTIAALSLDGTVAPGSTTGSTGTLSVTGDAVLAADSVYAVNADANGGADRLSVGGVLTLQGGTVAVAAAPGAYAASTPYTIATAASVVGTFSSVSTDLAFLNAALAYSPTEVDLVLTRNATLMRSVAINDNQRAVAGAIDGMPTDSALYLAILGQSATGARASFASLTETAGTLSQVAEMDATSGFIGLLGRAASGRDAGGLSVSVGSAGGALGYADDGKAAKRARIDIATPAERVWRLWGQGFAAASDRFADAAVGSGSVSAHGFGGGIGLDHRFGGIVAGLALGGSSSRWSVPGSDAGGTVDGLHVGPYASVDLGAARLGGSLVWSGLEARDHRTITVGGTSEKVASEHHDDEWRLRLEIDRTFALFEGTRVTPFAAIEAAFLHREAHTETLAAGGASTLGLAYASGTTRSLPLFLGLRAEHAFALPEGREVKPSLSLAWVHEFSPAREDTAAFAVAPTSAFTIEGARAARDSVRVEAGLDARLTASVSLFAAATGEFSDRGRSYAGRGGIRVSW